MPSSQSTHLLSEHPSNPLQVGSSDAANAAYVRQARLNASGKGKKVARAVYAGATPQPRSRKARRSRGLGEDESSDELRMHRMVGNDADDETSGDVDVDADAEDELDQEDAAMNDLDAVADSTGLVETARTGETSEADDDPKTEGISVFPQMVEPCQATSNPFYVSDDVGEGDTTIQYLHQAGTPDDEVGDEDAEGEDDEEYLNAEDHRQQEIAEIVNESSLDETTTLLEKDEMEQSYINNEMRQLRQRVRGLEGHYELVDRLGEGTFSSVYKAVDLRFMAYDNQEWNTSAGYADYSLLAASKSYPSSKIPSQYTPAFQSKGKYLVAIKRIYVTSSPQRIANEIELMESTRGCRHVSQLITAFRDEDQVVCVMPYHPSEDFRDYFQELPIPALQTYFRHLFRALRDVHARDIIHRDVKPANFLFDPKGGPDRTGWGVLCDFGLAQRVESQERTQCLHSAPTREHPHGQRLKQSVHDAETIKRKMLGVRKRADGPSSNIGYKTDDLRPRVKANRAGTRGFRAPEVLFKCESQTVALDIWSAGIILLAFLSGKFPLFNSNDDTEALAEIAAIVGRDRMERCARLHNRTFLCNIPSALDSNLRWSELAKKLNPSLYDPPADTSEGDRKRHKALIDEALNLLEQCLALDATKRITAQAALHHPFLSLKPVKPQGASVPLVSEEEGKGMPSDDELTPHPPGQGSCGPLHWLDVTEDGNVQMWGVQLRGGGTELVRADDPRARCVGHKPCSYHIGWEQWEGVGDED
ncbi:cell division control protein 7 [Ceratobasidium sp. AG-Ba]|nr:cell division control protein 7 [Ceratobasidium sp. AG-Ba]